jgi:signal transduction histidine kinase
MFATVLNVDDDPVTRESRRRVLEGAGVRVYDAESAADARRILDIHQVDLVLLGAALPNASAADVCRQIKSDPSTSRVCVLMVGPQSQGGQRAEGVLETSADAYLRGPVEDSILTGTVCALLGCQPGNAAPHENRAATEPSHVLDHVTRQEQRMDAAGQLAGGIAHEFNNLLTAILGYADLALDQAAANPALTEDLNEIRQAAARAGSLTRQLLAFSRRQVFRLQPVDLNTLIDRLLQSLPVSVDPRIEVQWKPARNLPAIDADVTALEQVVKNLILNAKDAMSRGGRLEISTVAVDVSAASPEGVPMTSGAYVRLDVKDTGEGMDAATRARIFEPFFTTRERGKGTGLGLSAVYGTVKQLAGYIFVDSEPMRGAAFRLYFPVARHAATPAADDRRD